MSSKKGRRYKKIQRSDEDAVITTSVRVLRSQREWADQQKGGWSGTVRRLLKEAIWSDQRARLK